MIISDESQKSLRSSVAGLLGVMPLSSSSHGTSLDAPTMYFRVSHPKSKKKAIYSVNSII